MSGLETVRSRKVFDFFRRKSEISMASDLHGVETPGPPISMGSNLQPPRDQTVLDEIFHAVAFPNEI
jgi:hypothetical protein